MNNEIISLISSDNFLFMGTFLKVSVEH
jgi:hypothetical protein